MTDGGEGWAPVDNADQDPADDLAEPKEKMMKKELNEKLENGTTTSQKVRVQQKLSVLWAQSVRFVFSNYRRIRPDVTCPTCNCNPEKD